MKLIKEIEGRRDKHGKIYRYGIFECEFCKNKFEKPFSAKRYKSCGCARGVHAIKHGLNGTKLYHTWEGMISRCTNKKHDSYKYYGGKGISVCKEWLKSFSSFASWALSNRFNEKLQIDRKNSGLNYSPDNCQFITNTENIRKRSNTKFSIEKADSLRADYKTGEFTQRELSDKYGVSSSSVSRITNKTLWV